MGIDPTITADLSRIMTVGINLPRREEQFSSGQDTAMAWVQTVSESQASPTLQVVYARAQARAGRLPNIARVQSLRPDTMARGFDLYCQIMDAPGGISKRDRVLIATVVSQVNGCHY